MLRKSAKFAGAILVFMCLIYGSLQVFPGSALSAIQGFTAWSAGFEKKVVSIDGYLANYYEAGPPDGPALVLLHGLIDDKNSFMSAAEGLTGTFRVILPDLQGHGENAQTNERDYSIRGQASFISDLLETLEISELTIGGNSMGGHVAAAFALSNQARVQKLILLNATGMQLNAPPTYYQYPEDIDIAYMNQMYTNAFKNPPPIPRPIMRHLASDLRAKTPFYNMVVEQVVGGEQFRLDEIIATLSIPTLIVWGTDDRIVPIQYAEAYDAAMPNSSLVILEAGHAPQIEIPQVTFSEIRDFLSKD